MFVYSYVCLWKGAISGKAHTSHAFYKKNSSFSLILISLFNTLYIGLHQQEKLKKKKDLWYEFFKFV